MNLNPPLLGRWGGFVFGWSCNRCHHVQWVTRNIGVQKFSVTMRTEGETIRAIRGAVRRGRLAQPFRAGAVNAVVGIDYADHFLQKHCDDRPDTSVTWLFDRIGRGLYRLTPSQQGLADGGF